MNEHTVANDELPHGWAKTTIGEVTRNGIEQTAPDGETFLYVDIGSIDNKAKRIVEPKELPSENAPSRARQRLCAGDVLVSMTRPNLNAVAFVPPALDGSTGSTGFDVLRTPDIFPQYLFHLVQSTGFVDAMSSLVQGALYPAVRPKDIRAYRFNLAPLTEQARIVARIEELLSQIDAGAAGLRDVQKKLKRYRTSVLKAACEGTLVPTEADLAPQENRTYEPTDVLLARILTERRARWEADQLEKMRAAGKEPKDDKWKARYEEPAPPDTNGLPKLPEGWAWTNLRSIAALTGGITKGQQWNGHTPLREVPYLRVANVQRGYIDLRDVKTIEARENEIVNLRLVVGDILFNEGGDRDKLGRGWVWNGQIDECIHQNHVFRARLYIADVMPKLISWYGNSTGAAYFIEQGKQTTNLASINISKLGSLPIPLAPLAEQQRIVAEVELRLSVIDQMEASLAANLKRADRLRQAVLRDAFAGKLVPQDPSDEPASALLERIRAARAAAKDAAVAVAEATKTKRSRITSPNGDIAARGAARNKDKNSDQSALSFSYPPAAAGTQ